MEFGRMEQMPVISVNPDHIKQCPGLHDFIMDNQVTIVTSQTRSECQPISPGTEGNQQIAQLSIGEQPAEMSEIEISPGKAELESQVFNRKKRNRKKYPFVTETSLGMDEKLTPSLVESEMGDSKTGKDELEEKQTPYHLETEFGEKKKRKKRRDKISVTMATKAVNSGASRVEGVKVNAADTTKDLLTQDQTRDPTAENEPEDPPIVQSCAETEESAHKVDEWSITEDQDGIVEPETPASQQNGAAGSLEDISLQIDFGKKKKSSKTKPKLNVEEETKAEVVAELYTYDELLMRLRALVEGGKVTRQERATSEKVTIPVPQVIKTGRLRTSFVNFMETANRLHRPASHLLAFLNSELGTICTVCSTNQLWIKGNFKVIHIEIVLRKYAKAYVTCPACRSGNTLMRRTSRLTFVVCDACDAKFSVGKITNGYRARVQIR